MTNAITIGVLSPVTGGTYYGKMLIGIAREVAAVGGRVLVLQTLNAGLSSDEVLSAPDFNTPTAWDHLDGVISIATATQTRYLDRLQAAGKVVALASAEIGGFDGLSTTPDNATGVTESVRHLVQHGHQRIGYAANLAQPDMQERYAAYCVAMLAEGFEPEPKLFYAASDNGELGGRDVAAQLVAAGLPLTALILATDRNAIGCMARLADLGVIVPDDLAIQRKVLPSIDVLRCVCDVWGSRVAMWDRVSSRQGVGPERAVAGGLACFFHDATEPVMSPVRRRMPRTGPLDLSLTW